MIWIFPLRMGGHTPAITTARSGQIGPVTPVQQAIGAPILPLVIIYGPSLQRSRPSLTISCHPVGPSLLFLALPGCHKCSFGIDAAALALFGPWRAFIYKDLSSVNLVKPPWLPLGTRSPLERFVESLVAMPGEEANRSRAQLASHR